MSRATCRSAELQAMLARVGERALARRVERLSRARRWEPCRGMLAVASFVALVGQADGPTASGDDDTETASVGTPGLDLPDIVGDYDDIRGESRRAGDDLGAVRGESLQGLRVRMCGARAIVRAKSARFPLTF